MKGQEVHKLFGANYRIRTRNVSCMSEGFESINLCFNWGEAGAAVKMCYAPWVAWISQQVSSLVGSFTCQKGLLACWPL